MKWFFLAILGITPPAVLAQATPVAASGLVGLLTGSAVTVLAAIVICFLKGWVVTGKEFQRVIQERDRAIAANEARAAQDYERLIPILATAAKAQAEAIGEQFIKHPGVREQ